ERIVFTYLDYLLYRDNNYIKENMKDLIVQFRTSIEHFFPQNPENNDGWSDDDLHCFGNLALITTSGNSKFSNYYPDGKINNYKEIIQQSPKLKLMASYTENGGKWTPEKAEEHQKEMFEILAKEINGKI
ncbi:MAG: HNH endonuclease family protein, partial [Mucispirillum sp.]|nr:HNH endonuclease family protein [Mucispirillum sp.]